ncbi:MAG TPA: LysR substrate-binding domain-containing protein [Candidatus Sulfotelmatobacter sp.]|jgi:DNA-binding transcriptional LysR family regulator
MDLEFSELHAFVVLAGELHFRKASERLFLSQPALSKKIQRLEEKLKGALFVRSRRRVALTDAGKSFLPKAAKLLQDAEDALCETQAVIEGRVGTLRVGFVIASVSEILPRTILRFRKLYPEIELQLRETHSPLQVSSLIEGRLDAGILRMPITNRKLVSVPLFSEHLVLATPADVPYRPKDGINRFRNSGFIFVSPSVSETFHDRVLSLCLRAGFTPRVVQEANEILTILHFVRAGVGVSLVPRSALRLKVPGVRFHELGWKEPLWRIGIAWNRTSDKLPLISCLVKVVQAVVGGQGV